jgi:hypothetical protein
MHGKELWGRVVALARGNREKVGPQQACISSPIELVFQCFYFHHALHFIVFCIYFYTMNVSCLAIITISVNVLNCWVRCSWILDKLWFWWIQKTLGKRWHLEKLAIVGGQRNSIVHLFLNFSTKWMHGCSFAWGSIHASAWRWWLSYSERCGRHLHIVELEICQSCKLTCLY